MSKKTWIYLIAIALCLVAFFCYRWIAGAALDSASPTITIAEGELAVSVKDGEVALLQGVTAQDGQDGDVTGSILVESVKMVDSTGLVKVTYAAFDRSGNVAKATRQVRYTDYEPPRFTLSGPMIFTEKSAFDVLSYITARDGLDGDISRWIRTSTQDGSSISTAGTHEVEFRVSNSLGDTAKVVIPVEVYPIGTYQGDLKLTDYLVYLPKGAAFDAASYLKSYTLSGKLTSLENGLPDHFQLATTGQVDTQTPGVYVLNYHLTYTPGTDISQSHTGYSKLIVIVEE